MTIYSQRDKRWKNDLMGTGTIGQYGCTMTCIAMKCNTEPGVLNREIKDVGGYSGNYLVWDKLDQVKDLDFIKRSKVYDNNDVKNNLPCLVEVDGTPIGGSRHWVLYIGNQKLWDPWTGTERPTSVYQPVGYAVVRYNPPILVVPPPVAPPSPPQIVVEEKPVVDTTPVVVDVSVTTPSVNPYPDLVNGPNPDITPVNELPTTPDVVFVNIKKPFILRLINWLLSLLKSGK